MFWEIIRSVGYVREKSLKLHLFHTRVSLDGGITMTQQNW